MPTPMQMVPPRRPKNSMAELRLRRLNEHNQRLKEDLVRPRIRVSEASHSLISFCADHKDPFLPSGELKRGEDPYSDVQKGCCIVQ